jgi:hypothetical protein
MKYYVIFQHECNEDVLTGPFKSIQEAKNAVDEESNDSGEVITILSQSATGRFKHETQTRVPPEDLVWKK